MTTILIIDDDQDILESMSGILRLSDYETLEAPNGEYGLMLLERNAVDLVLTDIFMPLTGGVEMTAEAKRRWPNLKVIAMSGSAGVGLRSGRNSGECDPAATATVNADVLLRKPFNLTELINTVEGLLNSTPRQEPVH